MTEPEFTTEELNNEEWRVIPHYPNYAVSTLGRIRRATDGIHTHAGRLMKPTLKKGYPSVHFRFNGKAVVRIVHRLMAITFLGEPPASNSQTNHKNGNPTDNRLSNLEWMTPAENTQHCVQVLGKNRGELQGSAKLTDASVLAIYHALLRGVPVRELAAQYSIASGHVRQIQKKRAWKHILADLPTDFTPQPKYTYQRPKNISCKITEEQAREVRALALAGVNYREIAARFGISRASVCLIKKGKNWRHLAPPDHCNNPLQSPAIEPPPVTFAEMRTR